MCVLGWGDFLMRTSQLCKEGWKEEGVAGKVEKYYGGKSMCRYSDAGRNACLGE